MSPADFNLRHLRALAATVRLGSFTAAARELGISQPAVTQAVARLEALTGTTLIERGPGQAAPTDAGILLAARSEAAAGALAEAFRSVRQGGIGGRSGADTDVTAAQATALLALADHGSYAAGAAALGLAQPSLHRSVAELERTSGVALVERRGRGVGLTRAGERLAAVLRLSRGELQAALDELAVLAGRDQGQIRIGADATALRRLLPAAVARFLAEHPPVAIEIEQIKDAAGADMLRGGRLDALIALEEPGLGKEEFAVQALGEDPLVIASRPGHPLAAVAAPGLVRLAGFGWALPQAGGERAAFEKLFLDGGLFPPAPSVVCPAGDATLELVARCTLLTVASRAAVDAANGKLVAIGDPLPIRRRLVLATRAGWAPTPAQATFIEELQAAARPALDF